MRRRAGLFARTTEQDGAGEFVDDLDNQSSFSLRDAVEFLRRRRLAIASTAALLVLTAFLTAVLWPPVYRSSATILVEEQEIPQDLVRTTVTSYADQRIQVIGQQVMTRQNLLAIVEKYGLYASMRASKTNEEVLERMRKDVLIDVLSADVANGRRVTIAFTLAYDSENPDQAQKVANELVTLYLNENLKIRQQKAAETASFLGEEARRLEERVGDLEGRLATFKRRNMGQLPELAQLNMQLRERTEGEIAELDREARLLEQRRFFLQSQLEQTAREAREASTGEKIQTPAERLVTLQSQYTGLRGVLAEAHPDMVRMRQQMQSLQEEALTAGTTNAGDTSDVRSAQIAKLETQRTDMRERLSESHPDVASLNKRIDALRTAQSAPDSASALVAKPLNPTYVALETQLKLIDSEQQSIQKKRVALGARLGDYEQRLIQTPQVEQEYLDLTRERENTLARFREMKQKQMEAQVAQEMEKERKGERFSLIDPPQHPERPRSPNRPLILLAGSVFALGGGVGWGGVREALDGSIKGPRQLARHAPVGLLSVIPRIETPERQARRRLRQRLAIGALVGGLLLALGLVHLFYEPLNVLWFVLLRRFGL